MARGARGAGHRHVARTFSALGALAVLPVTQASIDEYSHGRELQVPSWQAGVSCDDVRWAQMPWNYLSFQEKKAWESLGWEQTMWDMAHPIPTTTAGVVTTTFGRRLRGGDSYAEDSESLADAESEDMAYWRKLQAGMITTTQTPTTTSTTVVPMSENQCYQDLTEVQQDAVRILSYSISSWSVCKNPSCVWPRGIPMPDASCLEVLKFMGDTLEMRDWVDLTPGKQESLMLLGWTYQRWAVRDYPQPYAKLWSELLPRQQEAASFLGYSAQVWEKCEKAAPCITRMEILEAKWTSIMWKNMLQPFQDRLKELGYNEERWTNGDAPTLVQDYVDLNPGQKATARLAGFVSDTWDGCPNTQCEERFSYVKRKYGAVRWMQMSVAQRRAWQLLGHSEVLWTEGGMMNTLALQLTWEELSEEQRVQASFLGYNLGTWQGCNTKWGQDGPNASVTEEGFISTSIERTVRARMTIRRPFAEVSGNVYGAVVAQLPTSFIKVFETAMARALFCSNPPLSENPRTYVGIDGLPLCILEDQYNRQKHRVKVMTIVEGSIIVDFFLARNQTTKELPGPSLFQSLKRMLETDTSPLCQDMEFGKFAKVADLKEIPLSHLNEDELASAQEFEGMRSAYGPETACNLLKDAREGPVKCPTTALTGAARDAQGVSFLVLIAVFAMCLPSL